MGMGGWVGEVFIYVAVKKVSKDLEREPVSYYHKEEGCCSGQREASTMPCNTVAEDNDAKFYISCLYFIFIIIYVFLLIYNP